MNNIIDRKFLRKNPDHIFVFGDNLLRVGKGGAAALRDEPNTYGFITKRKPDHNDSSYYTPEEYKPVFEEELKKLITLIETHESIFMISKLGAGLANKYSIWEEVIEPQLKDRLSEFNNVVFLF